MKIYNSSNVKLDKRYYVEYYRVFKDGGKGTPNACYMFAQDEFDLQEKINMRFQSNSSMYKIITKFRED